MGIMITHHGCNNHVCNAHKSVGAHHTAKYSTRRPGELAGSISSGREVPSLILKSQIQKLVCKYTLS